jgi:hypothetical protein
MNSLVTFDQFNASKLGGSEPIPTSFKKGNDTIAYNDIKLHYNYGTPEEPVISDLFFELPAVSATGIRMKEEDANGKNGPYKKQTHSMMIKLDLSDPNTRGEIQAALDKMDEIHAKSCQLLSACKGKVKMHDFDAARPGGLFKNPVYWPRDEVTGEKVKGKSPNIWVKLRNYKTNKTLFTDLNNHVIDWKLLTDVDITFVPLLHFEKIYVGSKASLQVFLASAIIVKIVAIGTETRQTSTLEKLKKTYGANLADSVESQLADLRMARQETLSHTATSNEFGTQDYGTMHSTIPSQVSSSSSSSQGGSSEQASLQDFLSNAPTMPVPTTLKLNVPPPMKIIN